MQFASRAFNEHGRTERSSLRTAIVAVSSALLGGLAAAFIALAIDDGSGTSVVPAPVAENATTDAVASDDAQHDEAAQAEDTPPQSTVRESPASRESSSEQSAKAAFDPVAIFEAVGPSVVSIGLLTEMRRVADSSSTAMVIS